MSGAEDTDILNDIKALKAVLARKPTGVFKKEVKSEDPISENPNLCEPSTSKIPDFCPLTLSTDQNSTPLNQNLDIDESGNGFNLEESEGNNNLANLSDPEIALNLNEKIISLLSMAQKRLTLLLEQCRKRKVLVEQKIRQRTTDSLCRTLLTIAGIPYFKDKQQFPAPMNQDAKLKASRGELQIIELPCPLRWTLKDRNMLWEAIYSNAKAMAQDEMRRRESRDEEESLNIAEDPLRLEHKISEKKIPEEKLQNMVQLIGLLGPREFDWMKIAATDFNGRHSAGECRAMWNVFLHPNINKGKWKKSEDSALKTLADEYNFQNWDAVASHLGTNRSGYQCFIRFNTNFKNNMFGRSSSWSKEEDQKLTDTVNALRTGNFIPWGEVAKLMGNRRKQQIYMRWNYSLAPNLKKGRFTKAEDKLLLEGVAKFGSNFTKISIALLPHRNTAQLNDHYRTLINEKKNDWSCEDDTKLVKLFNKFKNNWSAIAKEFANKSRVQVRHRHTAITRYLNKGLSIGTIPRWGQKRKDEETPEEMVTKGVQIYNDMSEMMRIQRKEKEAQKREKLSKIDRQLRDYFKTIYRAPCKRGRSKKFYSQEELEERTGKLRVILNMLNADLDIPDDFEEETFLTEKDKQLLTSLKACLRNQSSDAEVRQKHVENIRRKMFGSLMPSADADRFVPPLPFDGKAQRTKRKKLVGMNYVPNGDKCLAEPESSFDTSEAITSLIGGWDAELEFKNLEKIFVGRFDQSPKDVSSLSSYNENSFVGAFDPSIPSTSRALTNGSGNNAGKEIATSRDHSTSELIKKKVWKYDPAMLIPPNYTTLLGFRGILLSKHLLEAKDSEDDDYEHEDCVMTPGGQKALKLFEDRLVRLFKFPIELSEVAPPLLHGLQMNVDDGICMEKRKASRRSSKSAVRKKPKLEVISNTRTPEAQ